MYDVTSHGFYNLNLKLSKNSSVLALTSCASLCVSVLYRFALFMEFNEDACRRLM